MYTSVTSAKLTRVITVLFGVLLFALMFLAPSALRWYFGSQPEPLFSAILWAFYLCCPAAWTTLVGIFILMNNIIRGDIFIKQNIFLMRLLSWCCALVALICFVGGFWYVGLFIFSLGAAFMMLILRVLKSVMARAAELKNENDLTI